MPLTPDQHVGLNSDKPQLKHNLKERDRYFGRWSYASEKQGGKHDGGLLSGVFVSNSGIFKALFKREKNTAKVLSEFIAGELWEDVMPEHSARTFLSTHNSKIKLPDNKGENIYLGSLYIDGYTELYQDIEEQRKKEGLPMPSWWPHNNGKVSFTRILNRLTGFYDHAFSAYGYVGFPQVMATSLLLADFGVHSANVGVTREEGKPPKLMRIDYGSSFKGIMEDEIHPNSRSRHLPLLQKGGGFSSNYFELYPKFAKNTPEFAAELDRVAAFDFRPKIESALEYASQYFGRHVFKKFGKRIGVEKEQLYGVEKESIIKGIAEHLSERIEKRQISLKNYASEIKTDLCLQKESTGEWKLAAFRNKETGFYTTFEAVVKDNPEYFSDIVKGKRPVHFRENIHKHNERQLGRLVKETAADILGIEIKKLSHVERLEARSSAPAELGK